MKINVTAASGQLGRKIVRSLLDQGVAGTDVIASVRTPEKVKDLASLGVTIRKADYENPQSLNTAFDGTEILMLVTSPAGVEPRIQQHFNALEAAKQTGVKRIVFTSFASATPASKFLVAPYYLYAESKLRLSGMDWTILRNGMYLDPIADWIPDLLKMGRLPYPIKSGKIAYIARDDIARAAASACLDSGHAEHQYDLTGSHALSMSELAEIISKVTKETIEFDSVTEQEFGDICRGGDENYPDSAIAFMNSLYRAVDNKEFESVTDHVEQLTGAPPATAHDYLLRVNPG